MFIKINRIIISIKYELQYIISGKGETSDGNSIQATANFLRGRKEASRNIEETEYTKEQEATWLIEFINRNRFNNRFLLHNLGLSIYSK